LNLTGKLFSVSAKSNNIYCIFFADFFILYQILKKIISSKIHQNIYLTFIKIYQNCNIIHFLYKGNFVLNWYEKIPIQYNNVTLSQKFLHL
jgi:hypothetical protein